MYNVRDENRTSADGTSSEQYMCTSYILSYHTYTSFLKDFYITLKLCLKLLQEEMSQKRKVLMVCLGNSCRSPIAEAVFCDQLKRMNMIDFWAVDSAALLQYHVGKSPEPRAMSTLKKNGITQYVHTARLIQKADFYKFDWIFGMDSGIVYDLCNMQPEDSQAKIELLGKYDPTGELNIRDPLFDEDSAGFEKAFKQANRSIEAFLNKYSAVSSMDSN